jgi:hypothetical protein
MAPVMSSAKLLFCGFRGRLWRISSSRLRCELQPILKRRGANASAPVPCYRSLYGKPLLEDFGYLLCCGFRRLRLHSFLNDVLHQRKQRFSLAQDVRLSFERNSQIARQRQPHHETGELAIRGLFERCQYDLFVRPFFRILSITRMLCQIREKTVRVGLQQNAEKKTRPSTSRTRQRGLRWAPARQSPAHSQTSNDESGSPP